MGLFTKKSFAELHAEAERGLLKRSLGPLNLTALGIGSIFGWIIGWDLILEYALSTSTVAVGWSGYVVSLAKDLGMPIPPALTAPPAAAVVGGMATSTG